MSNSIKHISFIMDGNGRWAKKRLLPRTAGHSKGVQKAMDVVMHAKKLGIPYISLYTFSKENWKRTIEEVSFLMNLVLSNLEKNFQFYIDNKIRIKHIGDREGLNESILKAIDRVEKETSQFTDITLLLAFNYSGKYDIIQAVNKIIESKESNITEESFNKYLLTKDFPDPDLIIRTSGEFRISNYFLYQAAYSEFAIVDKLWPDLKTDDIDKIINDFNKRHRRFGDAK